MLRKLSTTNAFVVTDLPGAPSAGVVRCAPKILQAGAEDLARSLTYSFAVFGMRRGGASAGINAAGEDRDAAIAAFAAELRDDAASGALALDAGRGVDQDQLEALTSIDGRNARRFSPVGGDDLRTHLAGFGPAVGADTVVGLEGRSVAIEGFGAHCPALADAVEAHGGRVIAVSTAAGALIEERTAAELRARWAEAGEAMVGADAPAAWKVYQAGADVLFVGSKMAAIDHVTAQKLRVSALVPHQPLPYTARALAVLQRAGVEVLPDFITTAGPIFADWPTGGSDPGDVIATASAAITEALLSAGGHRDGRFLGACLRAEEYLASWQDTLPFGRPLAS
jgi:glutamate dehydrogenase (NAD(P)+)